MDMSIVADYYRKHFLEHKHGYRREKKVPTKYQVVEALLEGQEYRTFRTALDSAIAFFEEKRNGLLDLPITSTERAIVESALGLLRQANSPEDVDNTNLRGTIQNLRDGMSELVAGSDEGSDLFEYVKTLTRTLSDLYTTVVASGPEDVPDDDAPGDAPEDMPGDGPADDFSDGGGFGEPGAEGDEPDAGDEEDDGLDNPETLRDALGLAR